MSELQYLSIQKYKEVVKVTIAFVVLKYCFLFGQSFSKFFIYFKEKATDPKVSFGKVKYRSSDKLALTTDRAVGINSFD